MTDRICENPPCSNSLEGKKPGARFCSDDCRYESWDRENPRERSTARTTAQPTTIQEVTAAQEATARAESLAVKQAILRAAAESPDGKVFADDVDVPESFRRLVPGQMNGLRVSKCLTKTSEYRNSRRGPRHGSGSWVYSITEKGREKLVEVGAGIRMSPGNAGLAGDTPRASADLDEPPASLFPADTTQARPRSAFVDPEDVAA